MVDHLVWLYFKAVRILLAEKVGSSMNPLSKASLGRPVIFCDNLLMQE